ncbi:unnamed protein product [Amoebophrya sp. A25]|nr:unnamed protein product [Amoebophrya sp. A25]|eukprot:GSA25T00000201001.1
MLALNDLALWNHGTLLHPAPEMRGRFLARRHAYQFLTSITHLSHAVIQHPGRDQMRSSKSPSDAVAAPPAAVVTTRNLHLQVDDVEGDGSSSSAASPGKRALPCTHVLECILRGFQGLKLFGIYPEMTWTGYRAVKSTIVRNASTPWRQFAEMFAAKIEALLLQQLHSRLMDSSLLPPTYGRRSGAEHVLEVGNGLRESWDSDILESPTYYRVDGEAYTIRWKQSDCEAKTLGRFPFMSKIEEAECNLHIVLRDLLAAAPQQKRIRGNRDVHQLIGLGRAMRKASEAVTPDVVFDFSKQKVKWSKHLDEVGAKVQETEKNQVRSSQFYLFRLSAIVEQINALFDLWCPEPLGLEQKLLKQSGRGFSIYADVQVFGSHGLVTPFLKVLAEENEHQADQNSGETTVEKGVSVGRARKDQYRLFVDYTSLPILDAPHTTHLSDLAKARAEQVVRSTSRVFSAPNADFAEDHKDIVLGKIFQVLDLDLPPGPREDMEGAKRSIAITEAERKHQDQQVERKNHENDLHPEIEHQSPSSSSRKKFFVEIGVGPGGIEHNTRFLRTFAGWEGLLLDSHYSLPRINLHQEIVTEDTILDILNKYKVPTSKTTGLDLLSFDVDGMDYHLCRKILLDQRWAARVIVVEHVHGFAWPNVAVPLDLTLVPKRMKSDGEQELHHHDLLDDQEIDIDEYNTSRSRIDIEEQQPLHPHKDAGEESLADFVAPEADDNEHLMFGSSATALVQLLNAFEYDLVYYGDYDLIFVRRSEVQATAKRWRPMLQQELADTRLKQLPSDAGENVERSTDEATDSTFGADTLSRNLLNVSNLDAALSFRDVNNLKTLCRRYMTSMRVLFRDSEILDSDRFCMIAGKGRDKDTHSSSPSTNTKISGYSLETLRQNFWWAPPGSELVTEEQVRDPTFQF